MSQFTISPCQTSDLDAMCKLFIAAFGPSKLNQTTYPMATCSYDSKFSWLRIRFGALFNQRELRMNKVVETATGRLVVWARWRLPIVVSAEELAARKDAAAREIELVGNGKGSTYPDGANEIACEAMFGRINAMKEKWVVGGEMYVLEFLATDPEFQRKGLGKMLMQAELKAADIEGRRVYLEASNEGHALYQRLGWKDVEEIEFDLEAWGGKGKEMFWVMIREPKVENKDFV